MRHNLPPRPIIKPPPATHPPSHPPSAHVFKNTPSRHRLSSHFIITRARTNHKHTRKRKRARERDGHKLFLRVSIFALARLNDVSAACNTQNRCSLSSGRLKREAHRQLTGGVHAEPREIFCVSAACRCDFAAFYVRFIISFTGTSSYFFCAASFKRVLMIARSRLLSPKLMERSTACI